MRGCCAILQVIGVLCFALVPRFGILAVLVALLFLAVGGVGYRMENERIRRERGKPSGPSWLMIALALGGLAALLGYARMRAKGYSSPTELLQDVAPASSR